MPLTTSPEAALAEQLLPLSTQEALVESNRCLFCYDAPCTHACPTHIDIPRFIKKISTDNLTGSARTILESNLLGATCARVCPVQELCEGACVLNAEHKPIMIGRLQRYAMDYAYGRGLLPFAPAAKLGKQVAVVGAGPAGLSCAGELARRGYDVTIFEKSPLGGGLSTYGIIALREPVEASLAEVEMIQRLGVTIETNREIQDVVALLADFAAVFLSVGLGTTPALRIEGEEQIVDGLAYIAQSKLDAHGMHIGRQVAVIGAGNTAIDCATIAKRLGAERVTMVYRRTERDMSAYDHEYEFIKNEGVEFRFETQPVRVLPGGLECVRMQPGLIPVPGSEFTIAADQIVKAIGQEPPGLAVRLGLAMQRGKICVNDAFETSIAGVYAGGDCIRSKGAASTVMGVQDGKMAAQAIHRRLSN